MQCAVATAGGWCGLCYVGRRGRETFKGHTGWRAPRDSTKRNEVMQFKRSAKADPMALKGLPSAQDASWAKHYPVLVEWMTATAWEDGAKRQPGSLLLIAEDGVWKAWVNDRDGQRSAWVSAGMVSDLLAAVDRGLAEDTLSWRSSAGKKR